MKEQKFKIGDYVTFKDVNDPPNEGYLFGGTNHGGRIGCIQGYMEYSNNHKCFKMYVTTPDGCSYTMLESEFVEYDALNDYEHRFKDGDFVIVGWLWNGKTYLSKFQSVAGGGPFNGYYAYEIGCPDSQQVHTSSFAFENSELGTIRLATTEEILKYLPKDHQDRKQFETSSSIIDSFPKEGHCMSTDSRLVKFLATKIPQETNRIESKHKGVAWSENSYWGVIREGGKPLYAIEQLLPLLKDGKSSAKTKKVEELEYPDAVHCTTKEQVKAINNALESAKLKFSGEDRWYLIGGAGSNISPYVGYGSGGREYINYEFSDLIFPETEDDYLNVMDIKVGDTVTCIEKNESKFNTLDGSAGSGWLANYEFKVTSITINVAYKIYFGGKGGYGVYSDAVRLVKRKADEVPATIVNNLTPNEWHTITTNSGGRYTAKFKTIDGQKIIVSSYYNNDNVKTGHIYLCDVQDISSIIKADMDEVYKHFSKEQQFSVGTYIVPLQNRLLTREEPLTKGKPYEIIRCTVLPYIKCDSGHKINMTKDCHYEGVKWFATEAEAEEFGKTIMDVKQEPFKVMYGKVVSTSATYRTHPDAIKLGCIEWDQGNLPRLDYCKIINSGVVNNNDDVFVIEQDGKHYLLSLYGVEIVTESEYLANVGQSINHNMTQTEYIPYDQLEPGQYYFEVYKDRNYIFKADSEDHQEVYIDTTKGVLGYEYTNDSSNDRIRLATLDECMWLDRCIEAKKYLTRKDALVKKPSENAVFKFKTGDAVISNCGWSKGLTGIVIAIHDSTLPYTIKFNNANQQGHNGQRSGVRLIYGKNIEGNIVTNDDCWFMNEKSIELATGINDRITTLDFTNDWESSLPTVNFLLNL